MRTKTTAPSRFSVAPKTLAPTSAFMLGVFAEFETNLRPERQAYQVVRHARDDQLHLPAVSAEREDACAHVEGALHERHGTLVRGDRQG